MQKVTNKKAGKIPANPSGKLAILRNLNFMLLYSGGFISRLGNGIHYIAIVWFIVQESGKGALLGTLLLLSSIPAIVFGPFAGVIADHYDRRKLMIWTDIIRAVVVLSLAVMIKNNICPYYAIMVATVFLSLMGTIFNPCVTAAIPNIVTKETLQAANSFNQFMYSVSSILGGVLGGILVGFLGVPVVIIINGITFLVSALAEFFVVLPPIPKKTTEHKKGKMRNFWNETKEGVLFVMRKRAIWYVMMISLLVNFLFNGTLTVAVPYIVNKILMMTADKFGVLKSFFPAGIILGSLIVGMLPEFKNKAKTLSRTLTIVGAFMVLLGVVILPGILKVYGVWTAFGTYAAGFVIIGCLSMFVNVPFMTILQRAAGDNMRGRVFGLLGTFTSGLEPIAMALTGYLLDLIPAYYIFIVGGAAMVCLATGVLFIKEIKTM